MAQGVSSVQINSNIGKEFYDMLIQTGDIVTNPVSKESIWEHRRTATKNFEKPSGYDEFWETYKTKGIEGIMKLVPAQTSVGLVIGKLKSMVR